VGDAVMMQPVTLCAGDSYSTEIQLFSPPAAGQYPLLAFSTGAFSHPDRYLKLLVPLAEAGYVVAAPVHQDYEGNTSEPKPSRSDVWQTRNLDILRCLHAGEPITAALAGCGISLGQFKTGVLGHSYGGLIAQLASGARATEPAGGQPDRRVSGLGAMVALSPPGPMPGSIDAAGWSSIELPSFTQTGTADILPGFVDDWKSHMAAYEATPAGNRTLWVGDGIDHYFNGIYGRERNFDVRSSELFQAALDCLIAFLDHHLKGAEYPSIMPDLPGATLTRDAS
jgi:hypothetical protein